MLFTVVVVPPTCKLPEIVKSPPIFAAPVVVTVSDDNPVTDGLVARTTAPVPVTEFTVVPLILRVLDAESIVLFVKVCIPVKVA